MALLVNKISTQDQLHRYVDGVCEQAMQIFSFDAQLCHHIDTLRNYGHEMISFMHEYDISPNIQANGYRSLFHSGINLIRYGIKTYNNNSIFEYFTNSAFLSDFKALIKVYVSGIKVVRRMREESVKISERDADNNLRPTLECSMQLLADNLYEYLNSDKVIEICFSYHALYEQPFSLKYLMMAIFTFQAIIYSPDLMSVIRCLFFTKFKRKILTHASRQASIYDVKTLFEKNKNNYLLMKLYPNYVNGKKPDMQAYVNIERSNRVIIDFDPKTHAPPMIRIRSENEASKLDTKFIRCRLLYEPLTLESAVSKVSKPTDAKTLIIFIHGGGFCVGSPEVNDVYLRYWTRKTPGLAILSIDISLAPEHKFPVPIQEIIDVYLTLTSGGDTYLRILGFEPRQIFLAGDSSGGNQSMSALVVLNEIKKLSPNLIEMMPKAIISLYPNYSVASTLKSSLLMGVTNPVLRIFDIVMFHEACLPSIQDNNNHRDAQIHYQENISVISYLRNIARSIIKNVQKIFFYVMSIDGLSDPKLAPTSQFSRSKDEIFQVMKNHSAIANHPFMSPSRYEDFNSLSNMTLYLVCCQNDPLSDHSIIMGRKWKGKLIVDVFNNMQHGFMNAMGLNRLCREANEIVLNRIQELCHQE